MVRKEVSRPDFSTEITESTHGWSYWTS